jgi:hypothetical protein
LDNDPNGMPDHDIPFCWQHTRLMKDANGVSPYYYLAQQKLTATSTSTTGGAPVDDSIYDHDTIMHMSADEKKQQIAAYHDLQRRREHSHHGKETKSTNVSRATSAPAAAVVSDTYSQSTSFAQTSRTTSRSIFSASPRTSASSAVDDGWSMSAADRATYAQLFSSNINASGSDGLMGGREALEFFVKSDMDTPLATLQSVWYVIILSLLVCDLFRYLIAGSE